ncbi:MAG: hypothetical protein ILA22_03430 [Prevotella sp.]|nr:hypothetical protein [Prevotella sp.]
MNIVIIILLVWLIIFLHLVWLDIKPWELIRGRKKQEQPTARAPEQETEKDSDFIGKSLVKVKPKVTNAASETPKAPQAEEGEEVDEKDVTFVPPKSEGSLRQMTPEEEKEAFKSFAYSKEELDDEDEYPAEGYATGLTSEEMEKAVLVANGAKASKDEELKAGKTLKEMDGTELLDLLTKKNPVFKARVRNLLDKCERAKANDEEDYSSTADKGRKSFMIEKSTDIDIRDFI